MSNPRGTDVKPTSAASVELTSVPDHGPTVGDGHLTWLIVTQHCCMFRQNEVNVAIFWAHFSCCKHKVARVVFAPSAHLLSYFVMIAELFII